ncbi:hypothetical protein JYT87_01320 [Nitrospira defluvii]|nr:hypothetical protein [Nitrospira defluvii]
MIERETIQNLRTRINNLVSSIKNEDLNDRAFISHKYMVISIHAYTERARLDAAMMNSREKLAAKKQHNLYRAMEVLLKEKAHKSTPEEMYKKILGCQKLVANYK